MRRVSRLGIGVVVGCAPAVAFGQLCHPPKDASDAKLLAFFTAPIAFSPGAAPARVAAGGVTLSFEGTYVPTPPEDIRRSTFCQQKSENTELSHVFPRPRLMVGLPGGLQFEASYLPPVKVLDAEPNLGSAALSWVGRLRTRGSGGGIDLSLRAHGTMGRVKGPITCPEASIQQQSLQQPCFGNSPSYDTYRPNMVGGDAALAWWGAQQRLGVYAGGGVTRLLPRFKVGFHYGNGIFDTTRVVVDLTRAAAFGGVTYRIGPRAAVNAEVYSVPADVTTARVGASWRLR